MLSTLEAQVQFVREQSRFRAVNRTERLEKLVRDTADEHRAAYFTGTEAEMRDHLQDLLEGAEPPVQFWPSASPTLL